MANERQLDDTGVDILLLAHLSLDERRGGSGESLNHLVDAIHATLDAATSALFRDRLTRVGYLSGQRDLYDEPRYTVREVRWWWVRDGFPRIVEADLRVGVGRCSYSISTAGLDPYRVAADDLPTLVRGVR